MQAVSSSFVSPSIVTYSAAYTLVPTYECFNRCSYCNFRAEPGAGWISLSEAKKQLISLQDRGVCELLILSGEVHPNSDRRSAWIQHIYDLCQLSLELGFLPHTNAGPLSFAEMKLLQSVNASMGLMLEQVSERLLQTVHIHAPSKVPQIRIQQLEQAGKLRIPFTTGILVGIGETQAERIETLEAIARIHQQYGHIQEAIVQPYNRGTQQNWTGDSSDVQGIVETVTIAREILPEDIVIQVPPNLTKALIPCLQAGARDFGGLGPKDEVNPDYPHPQPIELGTYLKDAGYELSLRLPVYPHYDRWVAPTVQPILKQWRERIAC
ncbi:MAG: 7,8-didemethyl-8-hydroxy-5-deazariboflavin synthase subunit CofG [Cyanobacteria bacterium J06597_1]